MCNLKKKRYKWTYLWNSNRPEVSGGGREEQPHVQGVAAALGQEGREELLHVQGQEGWPCEEIPLLQGKRNPSKMVGVVKGRQRADTLKPQSQKTSQSDYTTAALSNSVKLSHAMWGHPRWTGHGGEIWQNVVHWRREWKTTSVFLPWERHEQYEKAKW